MTKHDFIFSTKTSHRITRHLVFWLVFALIFTIQGFGDPLAGYINKSAVWRAFKLAFVNLPFCIISVYVFSNFLFPFLKTKKYASFLAGFILVLVFGVWINYYAIAFYFKLVSVNNLTLVQKIIVGYTNVWCGIALGGIVLGIKLAKHWYQQQNENLLLAKQKAHTELKLLKARIHPDFLFKTLDDIYEKINSSSAKSPLMILKLSEMLSYFLYESDEELVPLEKELTAVNDFISISKLAMDEQPVSLKIIGNTDNKFIAPLLLLNVLQNSFPVMLRDEKERLKTVVIISVEDNLLTLILSLQHVKNDDSFLNNLQTFIQSEQRRLNLLFPENNCVLRLTHQDNRVELCLIILLNTVVQNINFSKKEIYETA